MKPGDLVRTPKGAYLYSSIGDNHRIIVGHITGTFAGGLPALVVEEGSSLTGVSYVRVITGDGVIGWIRKENLEVVP